MLTHANNIKTSVVSCKLLPVARVSILAMLYYIASILRTFLVIDWCFTARQHRIGQFVPNYQGDYWLRRLRIANEEHTKHTVACVQGLSFIATIKNSYILLTYAIVTYVRSFISCSYFLITIV